ncbi:uncharacterized protein LOC118319617 isoform X2 [Scophthalmus maximus]|uniref:uncharacterized protein LOC118319617 isoform X2 n=1 Tax=Scophthalmus maximus TaxID=52904 RepID=UPI001FA93BA3|nr:uncharacterized protein LOC118319617 isoform X2 [Scophthalmus maximus]
MWVARVLASYGKNNMWMVWTIGPQPGQPSSSLPACVRGFLSSVGGSVGPKSAAEKAFVDLKGRFSSAPVLVQLDPSSQFIVEVDASDSGVGAVLSQRSAGDKRLHPCAFFSRKLSPAEQNYDVGNRELLAVKLALEEWTLAGRSRDTVCGLHRPQEPGIHPDGQTFQLSSGPVGLVLRPVQFLPRLSSGQQEHQTGCSVQTVWSCGGGISCT